MAADATGDVEATAGQQATPATEDTAESDPAAHMDPPTLARASSRTQKQYDLVAGKCYWTGDWCRDYLYHLANWHPLFSCICCDPDNPYNKCQRIAVLLVMSCLSLVPSMALSQVMDAGNNKMSYIGSKILTLIGVTLPIMVVQYSIEYLIWFQMMFELQAHQKAVGIFFRCMSGCMCCLKNCCFSVALYVSLMFVLFTMWVAKLLQKDFMVVITPFLISRVECWVLWFLTDMFNPCIGFYFYWKKEKRSEIRQKELEARIAAGEVMGCAKCVQDCRACMDGSKSWASGCCGGCKARAQSCCQSLRERMQRCCRSLRDICCRCCRRSKEAARPPLRNLRTAILPEDGLAEPVLDEASARVS